MITLKPWAYYNDFEPSAVAWLKELIKRGLIADGEVDGRSILDVSADDLRSFRQCHFFAGIGDWSYALRLAGWQDDWPVWTGSPPCQPFSAAGLQKGQQDERHLAPHFAKLVADGRPPILFGEQVASAAVFGKAASASKRGAAKEPEWAWIDDLSYRLEAAHYAVGASDIPAAGIGAPHIRQRTFFGAVRLADPEHDDGRSDLAWRRPEGRASDGGDGSTRGLADLSDDRFSRRADRKEHDGRFGLASNSSLAAFGMADLHSDRRIEAGRSQPEAGCNGSFGDRTIGGLGNGISAGLEGFGGHGDGSREPGRIVSGAPRSASEASPVGEGRPGPTNGFWGTADWLFCRDERWRPVEPSSFPLAHGIPARMGRLRGYGNAIVPQAAAHINGVAL